MFILFIFFNLTVFSQSSPSVFIEGFPSFSKLAIFPVCESTQLSMEVENRNVNGVPPYEEPAIVHFYTAEGFTLSGFNSGWTEETIAHPNSQVNCNLKRFSKQVIVSAQEPLLVYINISAAIGTNTFACLEKPTASVSNLIGNAWVEGDWVVNQGEKIQLKGLIEVGQDGQTTYLSQLPSSAFLPLTNGHSTFAPANVLLRGNVVFDKDMQLNYTFMNPDASIIVESNHRLTVGSSGTNASAQRPFVDVCQEEMWNSIQMKEGTVLQVLNADIKNGKTAIVGNGMARVFMDNAGFHRNNVSIKLSNCNNLGNVLKSTKIVGEFLKSPINDLAALAIDLTNSSLSLDEECIMGDVQNGINVRNSTLFSFDTKMINIGYDIDGTGIFATKSFLYLGDGNSFLGMGTGVKNVRSAYYSNATKFNIMKYGITNRQSDGYYFSSNNDSFSETTLACIYSEQTDNPIVGEINTPQLTLSGDHFNPSQPNYGILLTDPYENTQVKGWTITEPQIEINEARHAISAFNMDNLNISGGSITGKEFQKAITMQGGKNVSVACVSAEHTQGLGLDAIYQDGTNSSLSCNSLDGFTKGINIGTAMADLVIQGNHFGNLNIGLECSASGITGVQYHQGNRWYTQTILGYNHESSDKNTLEKSIFYADGDFDPLLMSTWATNEPGQTVEILTKDDSNGTTATCSTECGPKFEVLLNLTEEDIIKGNFSVEENSEAHQWMIDRNLIRKLLAAGFTAESEGDEGIYLSSMEGGSAWLFEMMNQAMQVEDATDSEQLTMIYNQLMMTSESVQAELAIARLDSTYDLVSGLSSLNETLLTEKTNLELFHNNLDDQKLLALPSLLTMNSQLPASKLFEENQVFVNSIILNLSSEQEPSTAELGHLLSIASQCPTDGGNAVYQARSFFPDTDWPACDNSERSVETIKEMVKREMVVPNPSSEGALIRLTSQDLKVDQIYDIKLLEVSGKHIMTFRAQASERGIQFQLPSGLTTGLYIAQVTMGEEVKQYKLIIE